MRSRLLLLAGGLLAGLVLAEGSLRLGEALLPCVDRDVVFWRPNRRYGWGHEPGTRGWTVQCLNGQVEWRSYSSINSRGLRDREIPYARSGGLRILVLGDSFTEALQVDREYTFTHLLETDLGTRLGPATPVEVINGGVAAWSTDNELLFHRHEGQRYRPDLVLLAFFTGNDVIENDVGLLATRGVHYPAKPHFLLEGGRLVARDYPLPPETRLARARRRLRQVLRDHSALYRFVTARLGRLGGEAQAAPVLSGGTALFGAYLRDYPPEWRQAWRITKGLVLRLRAQAARHGSRFAVVVINDRVEVSDRWWRLVFDAHPDLDEAAFDRDQADRLLRAFLARRGIPAIPLLEPFRAAFGVAGTPGFFPWDGHWDRPGHALAARVIARALVDQGLVGARP